MGFIDLGILDIIDILLVAILIYQLYRLVKGTAAINIFIGILSFFLLFKVVETLNMKMLRDILGTFMGVGVLVLVIVFQPELRRFLLLIGTTGIFKKGYLTKKVFFWKEEKERTVLDVASLCKAMGNMAKTKTGALIILSRETDLKLYSSAIDLIDAKLTSRMIESIFYKNSPLHDGAVIIEDNRLIAARAVLPVSKTEDLPAELGMRHRAALGIAEVSDAIAISVSEQTGQISYARKGKLYQDLSIDEMQAFLKKQFN
ncbi:MAG: diadenylate cyclase [Flavobacteriales bacterium]|nr:diadenylate cyclase [Flavobacteriales bacterium]